MKRLRSYLLAITFVIALLAGFLAPISRASAINTEPPAVITTPSVVITAFGGSGSLSFVELFNQSSKPLKIDDWHLLFTVRDNDPSGCRDQTFDNGALVGSDGWLTPGSYFAVFPSDISSQLADCVSPRLSQIKLVDPGASGPEQTIDIPSDSTDSLWVHKQRSNKGTSRDIDNIFVDDYKVASAIKCQTSDPDDNITLCSTPLYAPPIDAGGLQIVEILPHSKSCSPLDTSALCSDYVKLYNSGLQAINPAIYSLNYKSSSSNTVHSINLLAPIDPGSYVLINTDDSGNPIDLTNSGGYVWLGDIGGLKIYSPVTEYPSASTDDKIGVSYALDASNNWQWTSTPEPFAANKITSLVSEANSSSSTSSESLVPCAANQFRNPETNRCNLIVTAASLVPCSANQFRNPATNRCNNISTTAASLQPCDPDQYRNPATNRCKLISSASSDLQPCQPGWTRNPETNRCRKGQILADSTPKVQDVKGASTSKDYTGWIVALVAIVAALGYAAYEWRQELLTIFKKFPVHR